MLFQKSSSEPVKHSSGKKGYNADLIAFKGITRFTGQDQQFPFYISTAQVNPWDQVRQIPVSMASCTA